MAKQVGGAFVRIRPYIDPDDARALEALDVLSHDLAAAFDRFHARLSATDTGRVRAELAGTHDEGERNAA